MISPRVSSTAAVVRGSSAEIPPYTWVSVVARTSYPSDANRPRLCSARVRAATAWAQRIRGPLRIDFHLEHAVQVFFQVHLVDHCQAAGGRTPQLQQPAVGSDP